MMGVTITADPTTPIPHRTTIRFECDVGLEFFCEGFIEFTGLFTTAYADAMRLGWKQAPTGTYWCPTCSGKHK